MNSYMSHEQKERKMRLIFGIATPVIFVVGLLSGMLINDSKYNKYKNPGFQKIVEAYEIMQNEWYFGKDIENFDNVLIDKAINGMLDNGDPYTFYTSSMEEQGLSTNREGFGFSHLFYGGYRYINEVFDDSPAYKAGLLAGDVLMGFYDTTSNFVDFKTKGRDEGVKLLSAYEEDSVTFKVLRNAQASDISITRGAYAITGARVKKEVINNETVLYFDINTFLDLNIVNIVENGVIAAAAEGDIARVVFDVRDNGGGYVYAATSLVDMFVPRGEIIMTYMYVDGKKESVRSTGPLPAASKIGEYVIIQNESSASASETFTVAMRDLAGAKVVGTKSYGKGIIQGFHEFKDESVMRYTIAESLSPAGYSIHGIGITPDTEIKIDDELFFTYFGDEEVLSKEMKTIILKQINYILDEEFTIYELALEEWQTEIGATIESELNRDAAQELQRQLWDKYLEINELTYQTALGV